MSLSEIYVAGFNFWGILFSILVVCIFIFILYWLWTCPCRENGCDSRYSEERQGILPQHRVVPLYALELEPGIVVLQSEDGEIFRVLREYESVGRTGSGSPPLPHTVSTAATSPSEYHYMPEYTRAHYQTRPSAPLWSDGTNMEIELENSDPFGDGAKWTPIRTLNR